MFSLPWSSSKTHCEQVFVSCLKRCREQQHSFCMRTLDCTCDKTYDKKRKTEMQELHQKQLWMSYKHVLMLKWAHIQEKITNYMATVQERKLKKNWWLMTNAAKCCFMLHSLLIWNNELIALIQDNTKLAIHVIRMMRKQQKGLKRRKGVEKKKRML